ncbi:MAG: heme ABC exporter ATP-binding protein CcmA [Citromicrobium sp.]|nr:MAG: heme ABC exporter ATP-binding protein CcmA [Citromicrobium sp.]
MQAPPPAALAARDLACRRGDRLLFRGLSLAMLPGEAMQVVGANGTGKTSLLRILAGLLRPYAGTVERGGEVALLDGRLPLDEHLPLGRALAFWERIDGRGYGAEARARWGLTALDEVPVRLLSTGQRKRAGVLQANARGAPIWLLDEPLNGLDSAAAEGVEQAVAAFCAGGGAAVIASHQPFTLAGMRRIDLADYAP